MLLYLGVAIVAAATIAYEVALTRVFAVSYGYHFAFLAISLGLLGFGVSGTVISLRPSWRRPSGLTLSWLALAASVSFAVGYVLANNVPLDPYRVGWDPTQIPLLAVYLIAFSVPFLLAGLVQGLPITSWPERAPKIYAGSLAGSGVGGLLALVVLNQFSAPRALAVTAAVAALAPLVLLGLTGKSPFASRGSASVLAATAIVIGGLSWTGLAQPGWMAVQMSQYKPLPQLLNYPGARVTASVSNAQSRIDVVEGSTVHSAPGLSLSYQGTVPRQSAMVIDGEIVIPVIDTDQLGPDFFEALPTSLAYRLSPDPKSLVLQPGAGLEVAAALQGGASSVTAVEDNALVAELVNDELGEAAGNVYADPRAELVHADPRVYLHGVEGRFDMVSIALSENRRTVTAGAFSLSENYAMTERAFSTYLQTLRPGGLLAVHRWLQLPPTEEVRTGALVAEALQEHGRDPAQHMVAVRTFSTMLVMAKLEPFTDAEIAQVRQFAENRQFDLVHYPGIHASEANRFNVLRNDRYFDSFQRLIDDPEALYRQYEFDVGAPTDDRPFFFHFFKWEQIPTVISLLGTTWQPFGGSGYLLVLGLLGVITALSAAMILLPAAVIRRKERRTDEQNKASVRPGAYFAMLGAGFLLVEVALVGRLMLVLDHSALAFALVLFSLLVFSGLGSALAFRVSWRGALAALAVVILLYAGGLSPVLHHLLGYGLPLRIAASGAILAPLGFLMGIGFPRGLGWLAKERPSWLPMAWGVNGFTSVIGAVLAALASLSWGFSAVLAVGAAAYLVALAVIWSPAGSMRDRPAVTPRG